MKSLLFSLIFIPTAVLMATPAMGQWQCKSMFSGHSKENASLIRFTQGFIGIRWAAQKARELRQEFTLWRLENPSKTKKDFILFKASQKPFPAIRDIEGVIRIVDKHHGFYSYTLFYGREISFELPIIILKDYTLPQLSQHRGQKWTRREFVEDMVNLGYIGKVDGGRPSYKWLQELPSSIREMGDLPVRSLMSFVLSSFERPLSGSDFVPHIQNKLARKFLRMGIDPFSAVPFGVNNITRLRQLILERPELLDFMIQRVNPNLPQARYQEVMEFLASFR